MHSFHPYVQRRKRRRIGGRVVERRNVFWGKNVLFTTQVRRGVLRLFGISSAVFPSPPGSSSPWASAHHHRGPILKPQEKGGAHGQPWGCSHARPARPLGNSLLAWGAQERRPSESAVAGSLWWGLLYLSKERRLRPWKATQG